MGFTAASLNRFRARIDATLAEFFPCTLQIGETLVPAAGPGARTTSEFLDGGQAENFRFSFRLPKTQAPTAWTPQKGASLDWIIDAATTIPLEIIEVSLRPHEAHFAFTCHHRR